MFLLDTNVVSELRKIAFGRAHPNVERWSSHVDIEMMFISVVTVLEIETGILRLEPRDPFQAGLLRTWLWTRVVPDFRLRILDVDTATARHAARYQARDPRSTEDALIAATAAVHNFQLATRNVTDFIGCGVQIFDPWVED